MTPDINLSHLTPATRTVPASVFGEHLADERDCLGYQVETLPAFARTRIPVLNSCHFFNEAHYRTLAAWWTLARREPIYVSGPSGSGKTSTAMQFCARLGIPVVSVTARARMDRRELLGHWALQGGETHWIDGPALLAWKHGWTLLINEFSAAPADMWVSCNDILEGLPLDNGATGELVVPHPMTRVIVTDNTRGHSSEIESVFNEAGNAKWWTVAAPSRNIYSSKVDVNTGAPLWGNSSGTSMAAPHVTGALAVLMDRYDQMDALQVRDVMLTTASHTNPDGSKFEGWTAGEGQVDVRYGWGMPDLDKGMYGPGQFLGNFVYNMQGDSYDVWSNDISNEALKQRKAEDDAWLAAVTKWEKEGCPDKLGDAFTESEKELIGDLMLDSEFDVIGIEDQKIAKDKALEWRKTYYEKRKNAIDIRVYKGSLTKDGTGTLVMTGDNSYEGETKVEGGTLLAFAESIGTDNTVSVGAHGTFGVLSSYNDQFTKKGHLYSTDAQKGELKIEIAEGGTLAIDATSNVVVNSVYFRGNKKFAITLEGADAGKLVEAWNGEKGALTGSFKAEQTNDLFGEQAQDLTQNVESQYVFFELDKAEGKGNLATVSMKKKEGVTFEQFAGTANEQKIAAAIEASGNKLTGEILSAKTEQEISDTYRTLDDDFYATARNALVVNSTAVSRTVMDQARGMGEGRSAEVDNGRARIWAAGIGHWGEAEGTKNTMDVDFRTGFLGAEALVLDNTKVGAFFGYGTTDYKSGLNKIDGEDKHFGVYGLTDIGNVTMTYGVAYTDEDRDTVRVMNTNVNQHSENASVLQGFVEGAYNFDLSVAKVSPYVGFTWARVETDAVVDNAIGHSFKTDEIKDDIQIATLGVRTAVPFAMGNMPVALTADLGWSHYFGDTEGLVNVQMGEGGKFAAIEGSELKDQANLGLGIVGQVAKHATVGVSYSGSWGSDINTHGIFANVRFNF